MKKKPVHVISITSGKGGVGKTNVTVNLGLAIHGMGKRVLLFDADMGLANINVLLGFKPKAALEDFFAGKVTLSQVICELPCGLSIIPASSGVQELTHLSEQERLRLVAAIDELADKFDFMLVDTGAGIGSNVIYFNLAVEDILIVIEAEPTSITDAYAVIKVLSSNYGVQRFNVLVNRVSVGADGRDTFAKLAGATGKFLKVGMNYLGGIAEDDCVSEAVIAQRPFIEMFPSAKSSRDITRLATKIVNSLQDRKPRGGMQFFFQALLEGKDSTCGLQNSK